MSRYKLVFVSILVLGVLVAPLSHGVIVHIAKDYPQTERLNEAGEVWQDGVDDAMYFRFRVNNLASMRDVWTWSGGEALRNTLAEYTDPATGATYSNMSMFIFEDSGAYNLHDDVTTYAPGWEIDNLFFDWWGMFFADAPDGFGDAGQGGVVMVSAEGEMPTIDYSTVANAQWGSGRNVILSANHRPGQIFYLFDGLRFVCEPGADGWGNGVQSNGGNGSVPGFRNCVFEVSGQVFGAGGGQTHTMLNGPEFWRCAFLLTGTGGQPVFGPDGSNSLTGGDGAIGFQNCTFIVDDPGATKHIARSLEGGDAYTFTKCIFDGMAGLHQANADVVTSYVNNLEWPAFGAEVLKQNESGTVVGDPLFADAAALDFWRITPESPAAFPNPANNIGYDIWTASGDEEPPAPDMPVSGGLALGGLALALAAGGARLARRK